MITHLFQLLFWSALIFAFVMASLPQPPPVPGEPGDKVQHILAFLVLAALAALAFPTVRVVILFAGLAAFGGAIELVQSIPSLGREPSWLDWLADIVAAGAVLALVGLIRRWRSADQA